MESSKILRVKNRSASLAVYSIPEINIRREFAPGETKNITYGELEKLSYQPGGRTIMQNFLQIIDPEATGDLGINREPEYDLSEQQIVDLMTKGSLDAFLDCLDFAPVGVIDLIKKFSVSLPLNDIDKRDALKKKTGFDVTVALANMQKEKEDMDAPTVESKERRVKTESALEGRRTTPKYNVVQPTTTAKLDK
nr:MAG TPA: hypothetical protein [Caudoviricetes sp.]